MTMRPSPSRRGGSGVGGGEPDEVIKLNARAPPSHRAAILPAVLRGRFAAIEE